ncbi:hypothetical protein BJ508DRAFT_412878 [Ascobolus immersus RN42]|uniref:Galactose oxidase n=1 Tax=Ascobolus immersus RN42 TaxID=1160509 RepID=A0A3N4IDF5_ASCIM|nr:hypothetical protein BJ508DRAFT_412878 [Ascobolus immersus RN42]
MEKRDNSGWEWCWGREQMGTIHDNKLYLIGGFISEAPAGSTEKSDRNYFANPDLLVLDFHKDIDSIASTYSSLQRLPLPLDSVPVSKFGSFWTVGSDSLLLSQGELQWYPVVSSATHTETVAIERTPPRGSSFKYDISSNSWTTLPPDSDVPNSVVRGASTFSEKTGKGFVLGGAVWPNSYEDSTRTEVKPDQDRGPGEVMLKGMLNYDSKSGNWRNETTQLEHIDYATLTAIDDIGEEGILAVLGGSFKNEDEWRSLRAVQVYDVASKRWYNQDTTAEGGFFPSDRIHHCAVAVSSPDRSSHNIYIYGGMSPGKKAILDDVWVLSLPAFHWVKVSKETTAGRAAMSCNIVGKEERFLFIFGGDKGKDFEQDCDEGGPGRLFDLSSGIWRSDFKIAEKYEVPQPVYAAIGGGKDGKAKMLKPRNGFVDDGLEGIFAVEQKAGPSTNPKGNPATSSPDSKADEMTVARNDKKLGSGAIAGIVVGILAFLALVFLLFFFLRRRRNRQAKKVGVEEAQGYMLEKEPDGKVGGQAAIENSEFYKPDISTGMSTGMTASSLLSPSLVEESRGPEPPFEIGRMRSVYEKDGSPMAELSSDGGRAA